MIWIKMISRMVKILVADKWKPWKSSQVNMGDSLLPYLCIVSCTDSACEAIAVAFCLLHRSEMNMSYLLIKSLKWLYRRVQGFHVTRKTSRNYYLCPGNRILNACNRRTQGHWSFVLRTCLLRIRSSINERDLRQLFIQSGRRWGSIAHVYVDVHLTACDIDYLRRRMQGLCFAS